MKNIFIIIIILLSVSSFNCKKSNVPPNNSSLPTITTTVVTSIIGTTATSGGNVSSDGGATVTVRGVCWSTTQNPTTSDNKTNDGTGKGSFTSNITGLTSDTTYYIKAYATNSAGTAYGNGVSFTSQKIIGKPILQQRLWVQ